MKRSDGFSIVHSGTVLSVEGDSAEVLVDIGTSACSCSGCAMQSTCGREADEARGQTMVVVARLCGRSVACGDKVTVGISARGTRKAIIAMLAVPLLAFLLAAVLCIAAGASEGIAALMALGAASVCYIVLYFSERKRNLSHWILIKD